MSSNCRFLSLTISIVAITLYIMYHAATQYGEYRIQSQLRDYQTKIRLLKRDREVHLRRLQVYTWRWQTVRDDRELLSRRLNYATKELNQLKCSLQENVSQIWVFTKLEIIEEILGYGNWSVVCMAI